MPSERSSDRSQRRPRRRRHSEDDEGGISSWKLGLIVAVIVVCFAVLYPSVLHPMFFGRPQTPPAAHNNRPPVHPGMGGGGRGPRADMHPAMRMAAAQAETQSSGKGGMYTWMLPIYTVGVVIFLLYTLFKNKKKNRRRRRRGSDSESEEEEETTTTRGPIGRKKLRGLQERLRQTEEAMSKILAQLEAAQAAGENVGDLVEGEQEEPAAPSPEKEEVAVEEAPSTSTAGDEKKPTSEYMKDLEEALQEFKQLSDSYDKAKRNLKGEPSEEEDDVDVDGLDESELSSEAEEGTGDDEEEEEEVEEPKEELIPARKKEEPKGLRKRVRRV